MFEPSAREEYLRRAEEAEKQERRATDLLVKEAWERIVVGYLELAEIARRQDRDITYSTAEGGQYIFRPNANVAASSSNAHLLISGCHLGKRNFGPCL